MQENMYTECLMKNGKKNTKNSYEKKKEYYTEELEKSVEEKMRAL